MSVARSDQPIRAERVFELRHTPEGWMLEATATHYRYEGPIARNPVPPWTADEFDALIELIEVDENGHGDFPTPHHAAEAVRRFGGDRVSRIYHHPFPRIEGFHAFRPGMISDLNLWPYNVKPVLGVVELFGRVVEYERGYRAEKMRIEKLTVHPRYEEAVSDLEKRYHCDVEVRAWQTWAERSGSTRSSLTAASILQALGGSPPLFPSGILSPPRSEKKSWFQRIEPEDILRAAAGAAIFFALGVWCAALAIGAAP